MLLANTQLLIFTVGWVSSNIHLILGSLTSIILQISSALLPETNFTCTADNICYLSQVMNVHHTLRSAANEVKVIALTADEW